MKKLFLLLALFGVFVVGCENLLPNELTSDSNSIFVTDNNDIYIVEADGGEVEVTIATDVDYSIIISESARSWLSVADTRVDLHMETKTFIVAENNTIETRLANVEFIDDNGNVLKTIVFSQKSYSKVFETDAVGNYIIDAEGGVVYVTVTTNLEYDVIIPEDAKSWLNVVDTSAAVRNETLIFIVSPNEAIKERSASVTLIDTNRYVLLQISFCQLSYIVGPITLAANKTTCTIGDTITFTVTDSKGQDVTNVFQIYDPNFNELTNKEYTATEAGTYEFFATCDGEYSDTLVIKVLAEMPEVPEDMEPANFKFNHRAVLIDHTGLACGNCPNMMDNLHAYALTPMAQHYEEVTCHGGYYASNFGDPAYSTAASILDQFQGNTYGLFSGYPAVVLNFRGTTIGNYLYTDFKQYMDQALNAIIKKDGADVGIAVTVEGDVDNILCAAQIKVAVDGDYFVNAWLLENDIYSPNQSGATKELHRWYNRALRNVSEDITKTNIAGLEIGELKAGESYTYACTIGITSTKWNWQNMGVLVVVSAKDDNGRIEVVNSAYCPVGEQQPFEYL